MMEFIAQFAGAIAGTYLLAAVLPSNIVVNTVLVSLLLFPSSLMQTVSFRGLPVFSFEEGG